ncbi:CRISPR-associated exonuclease Cas4 [Virgibacillus natechei]|uniref:CRISPR-associated exonuclease Cas4 n=1 Tax=Virgibacillus natechei TaxID=1216297 RepID=A0ABS4IM50_9BACI|nr:CRISPR-associated protein Cas4 [Virgibacillus natechei]MBP1971645.1 CRISPR-associated exonuclease Cas4 [Virgibacillus natechei]UZD13867.1 CRISPR-associated protein Cas4 [Virgibacillus natechei]
MTDYKEEEYLLLSGIQHFAFCRRQWALIHIEQEWEENVLTVEGNDLHEKTDNPFVREKRGETIYVRAMPVHSRELGLSGICDMVEFIQDDDGIPLNQEEGLYRAMPIEYKRGKPKKHDADTLQLVAQIICLEEMLGTKIHEAALYYNEIKRREILNITDDMKQRVEAMVKEMHHYYQKRYTPRVKTGKHCLRCSLRNICLPELLEREKVSTYMNRMFAD